MTQAQTKTNESTETKIKDLPDQKAWAKMIKDNNLSTVSSQIRFLDSEGYKRSQIAKHLGKRYQHVRNVLTTPLKKPTAPATK